MGVQVTTTGRLPSRLWDEQASAAVARAALAAIDRRTFEAGLDVNDEPFAEYSAGYAAQLARAGESTRVDLNRSGKLRSAVASSLLQADDSGAVLGIRGPERDIAAQVSAARPFFAISPRDRMSLLEVVRAEVVRVMGGP